jgi:hypothetical protein
VTLPTRVAKRKAFRVAAGAVCLAALAAGVAVAGAHVSAADASAASNNGSSTQKTWSFGVISDTQWTIADDGYNPNTIAANIIKQIDQQFIMAGVDLVVAVGDTVNTGSQVNIDTRALYAQDLYNAGIGFYPLRGNHEVDDDPSYTNSGLEMRYAFPQIGTGVNNNTPADITTALIPTADLSNNPPAAKKGRTFTVGTNFSEPTAVNYHNNSVSYSFRYNNATFVLLDQFNVKGEYLPSTIADQQPWIDSVLKNRPKNTQAFVFAHKNILGGNHKDNMFGANYANDPGDGFGVNVAALSPDEQAGLAAKIDAENAFIASMQKYNVPLVISGHDHHHYLSQVTSPDGLSKVNQLITQSDSSKFYTPKTPASDNDVAIQQDLGRIGYYIFTVGGTEVTIDYYADDSGIGYGTGNTPFHFVKVSTVSYNLNGMDPIVAPGGSYAMSDDTTKASAMDKGFKGTSMAILDGTNVSPIAAGSTNYGKAIEEDVTTGWEPAESGLSSDILVLSGMSLLPGQWTDQYVLSMSTSSGKGKGFSQNGSNKNILLTQDQNGKWVSAVSMNIGGTAQFVTGPWQAGYGLGTYGVDPRTNSVWAVLDYDGEFAVGQTPAPHK